MSGIGKDTFKQIFVDHWEPFKAQYPRFNTPYYDSVIEKMLDCGDPDKMGYVKYRCPTCGEFRCIGFTCKSCFCLSCAPAHTDQWTDFVGRRLFPGVTYRHSVLTMPDSLHRWFYRDPALLSQLMPTGHAFWQDVLQLTTGMRLDIGSIIVLQTFGRSSHYNPHLHILFPAGGITPQGQWKAVSFVPYHLMHKKWQYHLLNMLRENVSDPDVQKDIDQAWKKYPCGFVAHLQPGKVPPGGQGLARYLAKYVVSPPIAVRRIEHYDGRTVRYWYQDHKTDAIQHETLPVLRFVGRMVQHILPKGFQRVRYYGLHSNPHYKAARNQLDKLVPAESPPDPRGYRVLPRKPFAQRFLETFGEDPLLCPRCETPMKLESVNHPDYGVIKAYFVPVEAFDGRTDPQEWAAAVATGNAQGDALATTQSLVQIPLPFM